MPNNNPTGENQHSKRKSQQGNQGNNQRSEGSRSSTADNRAGNLPSER